jgi:2-C-methyl-D-erythritol 4-phosphate cytidylyltransferase
VFRRTLLEEAFRKAPDLSATDEAQLVERLGHPVSVVTGSSLNLKITTKEDLKLASLVLRVLPQPRPAGPIHPFDEQWR